MANLQSFLSRHYDATVLGRGDRTAVESEFKAAMVADPRLRGLAVARLESITDDVTMRCHNHKVYRDFLQQILKDINQ